MRTIPFLLLLLVGLACSAPAPKTAESAVPAAAVAAPAAQVTAAFTCPDSTVIYAIFSSDSTGASQVALAIGDERLHLPRTPSADGGRYADSSTAFWNKGNEGTLERGGVKKVCVSQPLP